MKELGNIWKNERKVTREEIINILAIVMAGVITYYQMPTNWLTNPDGVWNSIYFRMGHGGEKVNGRLFQILVDKLRMNMITPVLTTVVCVLLLSLTACTIARIFESKNTVVNTLIGMVLIFAPCTSGSLTYYYCSDSFMLALFFAVLGVWLVRKYKSIYSMGMAIVLFTASLYLYQAYICVVFTLAVMLVIWDVLESKKTWKEILVNFGYLVVASGVGIVLYMVSFKLLQIVLHMNVRADRGMDFTNLFGENGIFTLIKEAYINFYQYFFGNRLLNNEFGDRNLINLLVIVVGIVIIAVIFVKRHIWKNAGKTIILFAGVVLLPLAAEAITVMSPQVDKYGTTGIIMIPTMAFIYIFVLLTGKSFAEKINIRFMGGVAYVVVLLFLWNSVVFTNLCINSMKLNLNKTETVADLMLEQIVEAYGYEKGTELIVAGNMEDGNFPSLYEWPTETIKGTSASYGFMWDTYTGNENCWVEFLKQYKGVQFTACDQEKYEELLANKEYQEMPLFPEEGSVRKFGDIVVVKMSDVELE